MEKPPDRELGMQRKITRRELATEPTPAGLQFVMPGCEKDQTRGPKQLSLF